MADKTIGQLPLISSISDTSLLPVEDSGTAYHTTGAGWKQFVQDAIATDVAAVAAAARLGIFIKNVSHLELASKLTAFVFDKTGTLTDGLLSVVRLQPFGSVSQAELLQTAGSVEQASNHPTAKAIQKLADNLSKLKGVLHVSFSAGTTGEGLN